VRALASISMAFHESVPVHTQMAGQCRDRRVIVGQSVGGPTYGSQSAPRAAVLCHGFR
jgi:hypothetical protein